MTFRKSFYSQKRALKDTIFSYSLIGVLATAGSKTAGKMPTNCRTNEVLIETNEEQR